MGCVHHTLPTRGCNKLDVQLKQTGLDTILLEDACLSRSGTYNVSLAKIPCDLNAGLYNPNPSSGSTMCDLMGMLCWDPVSDATGYEVYFGLDVVEPLSKIGETLSTCLPIPAVEAGKVYYWHILAHTPTGDITGPYWWFETCSVSVCEGDFDKDGDVDGSDLAIFSREFGRTDCSPANPCRADFDNDGDEDGSDLAVFSRDFGRTDCP